MSDGEDLLEAISSTDCAYGTAAAAMVTGASARHGTAQSIGGLGSS